METLPCGLRSVATTASFPTSPSSAEVSTPTTPSLPDGRLVLRAICEKALVGNSLERRKTERKSIVVVETSTMANGSTRGSRFIEPASNTMLLSIIAKARVTVRANIKQLVGGAGEETVLARVGEGIVSSIGSSESHKEVLENPDSISKLVLKKGLDAGTAFEILSIDIADIDIGKNIGAALQIDQANADKNIAQAKAEERRAMAVAHEQEMIAQVQEQRAKVVEAEAQVPLAMAAALKEGKLGVMDYYQMQNTIADTTMRDSIAKASQPAAPAEKTQMPPADSSVSRSCKPSRLAAGSETLMTTSAPYSVSSMIPFAASISSFTRS